MLVFSRATTSLGALMLVLGVAATLPGCGTSESTPAHNCPNGNTLVCKCSCDGKETTFNACFTVSGCEDYVGKACTDAGGPGSTFGSCNFVEQLDQCCF